VIEEATIPCSRRLPREEHSAVNVTSYLNVVAPRDSVHSSPSTSPRARVSASRRQPYSPPFAWKQSTTRDLGLLRVYTHKSSLLLTPTGETFREVKRGVWCDRVCVAASLQLLTPP